ncbi:MAG TPA: glycosyltransferase N-terminal domain-containing protein [Cytophagales bacterium]|nr:glycosyltransferase N-terminal domain-containing protein [Cytophagales bacterium]
MEKFLYNLAILSYLTLIRTSSVFNTKAKLWIKGRKKIFKRLSQAIPQDVKKLAWFHCASVGEFEQGRPLIERFRHDFPDYKILLTFFSPSGYELRKNYPHADYIFYLPIDNKWNARKFLAIVKPTVIFFIKYEFWYNYIREIKRNEIPLISVSAIFRESQLFFKPYGKFYASLLKNFNHIFVQDEQSKKLLESINYKEITVAGDTRFDRVKQISTSAAEIPLMEKFRDHQPLIVAGSTWSEDMDLLIPFINSFSQPLKLIIAPHEIDENQIEGFIKRINKKSIRFSQVNFDNVKDFQILFIDNIGMLSSLYRYGNYAFIGGGFGKGIHNILEAVVQGIPVFFGPNYQRFKEARDMIKLEAAFSVKSNQEFAKWFSELYHSPEKRIQIKEKASDYIEQNTGATSKIIDYCKLIIR